MSFRKLSLVSALFFGVLSPKVFSTVLDMGIYFHVDQSLAETAQEQKEISQNIVEWVEDLNYFYQDSYVGLNAVISGIRFADYTEGNVDGETLLTMMQNESGAFAGMFDRAREFGADYNVLVGHDFITTALGEDGQEIIFNICGLASQGANSDLIKDLRHSVSILDGLDESCGALTLAHELGHNQGLVHGDYVNAALGIDDSQIDGRLNGDDRAKGWGEGNADKKLDPNEFSTIMVGNYQSIIEGESRLVPVFSSPSVMDELCGSDRNCGDFDNGDVIEVINENNATYTGKATPDVHTLTYSSRELSNCIRSQYPVDHSNDNSDIDRVYKVECASQNISSIGGLSQITGLVKGGLSIDGESEEADLLAPSIDLSNNLFVDLKPLFDVRGDSVINLSGNNVANCHQLEQLQKTHPNLTIPDQCLNIGALLAAISVVL